jgi:hypothetical protein
MARLGDVSSPIIVLRGPLSQRAEAYGWLRQRNTTVVGRDGWLGVGALMDFAFHMSRLGGDWSLLWGLLDVQDLVIDEPLRELADQGSCYTELFRAIWEIRFLLDEGHDVRSYVEMLTAWMVDGKVPKGFQRLRIQSPLSPRERVDLLLFLFTLAQQNNLVTPTVFVFDGLDRALQQPIEASKRLLGGLLILVEAIEYWATLGSSVGLLIGMPNRQVISQLRRSNVRLYRRLRDNGV